MEGNMKALLTISMIILFVAGTICLPVSSAFSSDVPDIGPSGPVGYYDEDMNYHSY